MRQKVSLRRVISLSHLKVRNPQDMRGGRATKKVSDKKGPFINFILDYTVKLTTSKFYYMAEVQ